MGRTVIVLEDQDMIELQCILIDKDEAAALAFLKNTVAAKLPTKGASPCDSTRNNPLLLPRT